MLLVNSSARIADIAITAVVAITVTTIIIITVTTIIIIAATTVLLKSSSNHHKCSANASKKWWAARTPRKNRIIRETSTKTII